MKGNLPGATRLEALCSNLETGSVTIFEMKRPESSAREIAGKDRQLASLMRAAEAFEALDQRLQAVLSEVSRGRIRVACVDQGELVLAAESPVWATRARLEADTCLDAAREIWPGELRSVKVIVQKRASL